MAGAIVAAGAVAATGAGGGTAATMGRVVGTIGPAGATMLPRSVAADEQGGSTAPVDDIADDPVGGGDFPDAAPSCDEACHSESTRRERRADGEDAHSAPEAEGCQDEQCQAAGVSPAAVEGPQADSLGIEFDRAERMAHVEELPDPEPDPETHEEAGYTALAEGTGAEYADLLDPETPTPEQPTAGALP